MQQGSARKAEKPLARRQQPLNSRCGTTLRVLIAFLKPESERLSRLGVFA